jgi:hypothetical protein
MLDSDISKIADIYKIFMNESQFWRRVHSS